MVHSGAQENFLNSRIEEVVEIENTRPLDTNIIAADRHVILAAKDSNVHTLKCEFGDLGAETTTMIPAPIGKYDAILGLPWLQEHNPVIDWTTGAISKRKHHRPQKKAAIATHPRIFFQAVRVAGSLHGAKKSSRTMTLARNEVKEKQKQAKAERRPLSIATTSFETSRVVYETYFAPTKKPLFQPQTAAPKQRLMPKRRIKLKPNMKTQLPTSIGNSPGMRCISACISKT